MREHANFDPSELNAADITALVLAFISLAVMLVAANGRGTTLMFIAAVIALPAAILKVRSSRAKSRRWHQLHGQPKPGSRTSADA
ncbi:MAG TPA: hypothetical protein VF771_01890 [Longimicrobiaceae bacterium]